VDWLGIGLLTVGLACLQTLLEQGQEDDWFDSRFITTMALTSLFSLAIFVWWELRVEHPAVDLRVLRYRSVAAGSTYSIVLGAGLYGALFAIPIFTQNYLHFTAMQTGELLMPSALAAGVSMIIVGKLVGRFDPRVIIAGGALVTSGVMFSLANINPDTGAGDLLWPLIFRGLGSVMMFLPLSIATLGSLPRHEIPAASGFYNLTRQLGGSLGIAILTTLLARHEAVARAGLVEKITPFRDAAVDRFDQLTSFFQGHGFDIATAQQKALGTLDQIIAGQSAVKAFSELFFLVGLAFLFTLPLLLLLGKGANKKAASAAH
jgi:DHA2 family multidrug resistance protein